MSYLKDILLFVKCIIANIIVIIIFILTITKYMLYFKCFNGKQIFIKNREIPKIILASWACNDDCQYSYWNKPRKSIDKNTGWRQLMEIINKCEKIKNM